MKRGIWILGAFGVLLIAVMAAPQAEAACTAAVQAQTGIYPNYSYTSAPAAASISGNGGALRVGRFWEPGSGATQSSGSYSSNLWWPSYDGFAAFGGYIRANLTDAGVAGCPGAPNTFGGDTTASTDIIVLLEDKAIDESDAYYYAARVSFDVAAGIQYDMGPLSAQTWTAPALVPIPKPFITSSGRSGATVTLDLTLADVAAGFQGRNLSNMALSPHASITAYQLCSQEKLASAPAPTRDRTDGWVCADVGATMVGGRTVTGRTETCANTSSGATSTRRYLATGLSFDSGARLSTYVSRAVVIPCDPTVATPGQIEQRRPERPGTDITPNRQGPKGR